MAIHFLTLINMCIWNQSEQNQLDKLFIFWCLSCTLYPAYWVCLRKHIKTKFFSETYSKKLSRVTMLMGLCCVRVWLITLIMQHAESTLRIDQLLNFVTLMQLTYTGRQWEDRQCYISRNVFLAFPSIQNGFNYKCGMPNFQITFSFQWKGLQVHFYW